jgi:hypothetical protein
VLGGLFHRLVAFYIKFMMARRFIPPTCCFLYKGHDVTTLGFMHQQSHTNCGLLCTVQKALNSAAQNQVVNYEKRWAAVGDRREHRLFSS